MRMNNSQKLRVLSIMVFLALILGTAGIQRVFARDCAQPPSEAGLRVPLPPTPVEPAGTYWTNDLQYKWTVVSGAVAYQYRVWDGGTKVWEKLVSSSACGSAYCKDIPTELELIDGTYKWQVMALAGGVWTDWSSLQWYSIKAGFNSQFTSDAAGWQPTYGAWSWDLFGGNYRTTGLNMKYSASRFDQVYGYLTYEVKLRRQGTEVCMAYGILFNGQPWPLTTYKNWNHGYTFLITRSGRYTIQRIDNGVVKAIVDWTDSSLINNSWYNRLKVTYNKDTGYAQFFINGTRVYEGTLDTYKWGNVGVTMWKGGIGWEVLLVDWATLDISAPSSAAEVENIDVIYVDESAAVPGSGDDTGH